MTFKRTIISMLAAVMLISMLSGCDTIHFHDYSDATCTAPMQCECGETWGSAKGHKYSEATCTQPQMCERCGKTNGKSLGHVYTGAPSCTEPQVCTRCGKSAGTVLGHDYSNATCTAPKKCARCGITTGNALGHSYSNATCTSPQICIRCGEGKGAPLGHAFAEATCELPQRCTRCGNTEGNALGHYYADDHCIRCGEVDPDTLPTGLEELHVINSSSYDYFEGVYTDSYGNEYNGAHRYGIRSESFFSVHNLKKEYKTLTGSFVADGTPGAMRSCVTIEIYVDDALKYRITDYTKETGKIDFTIDVTNATKLKIFIPYQNYTSVALVNAQLYK